MAAMGDYRVLDGGLATELMTAHNIKLDGDPLWGARLIMSHADVIKQVHISYLEAGADLIETATYQASVTGFMEHFGIERNEAIQLIAKCVDVCKCAVQEFWRVSANRSGRLKPLVVGSLGPYGAHLQDFSEYSGNYVDSISVEELMDWHRPQVKVLIEAGVDIVGFETIPAQKEADALVQLLKEFPTCKAWISFSCKDGKQTCHGEDIADATAVAASCDQVVAVGINCTDPCYISELLSRISVDVKQSKSVVVYPNSGALEWPGSGWLKEQTEANDFIGEWMKSGAKWIGGCCCVRPPDISLIRSSMLTHQAL